MEKDSPAIDLALVHSTKCQQLLEEEELNEAIRYCIAQGIEPPLPPCDKRAPDYAHCVEAAKASLSDYGWWKKRLKLQGARTGSGRVMGQYHS